jgi:hypothetical protein
MISQQKKHKRVSPMPIVSSFTPPNRETVHSEVTTYILTAEQLAEVIAKYGAPTRPYGSYSSIATPPTRQQGGAKRGKQVRGKKDAS